MLVKSQFLKLMTNWISCILLFSFNAGCQHRLSVLFLNLKYGSATLPKVVPYLPPLVRIYHPFF